MIIRLALKLDRVSVNTVKNYARALRNGLIDSEAFPEMVDAPDQLETGVKSVEEQEATVTAAAAALRAERVELKRRVKALKSVVGATTTACVSTVSRRPEVEARAALQSANIPLRGDGAPTLSAGRPSNLHVARGSHDGSVQGRCDREKQARLYRLRASRTVDGPWETLYEGTKARFTISGLAAGDWYFQMAAIGTNGGWSEWSDVASCVVV